MCRDKITWMINRKVMADVIQSLDDQAAVALLGPRQIGKTTLSLEVSRSRNGLYLDLENPNDREKLRHPSLFLSAYEDRLIVLDEIHRVPDLFSELRGIIDQGRRNGRRVGRFLLLGSASLELIRQSSESLAGRIRYLEMGPLMATEVATADCDTLWVRGGFPDSFLSPSDRRSVAWREDLIRTYLERDIPMFGPRIPSETLRRFWTMLAHTQGGILNAARLAASLEVSAPTINRYIDLLVDLLMVRRLRPYSSNVGKRLVKSPKIYIRDSGLVHALLNIPDFQSLLGHPVVGGSWEGFVIENLIAAAPPRTVPGFYRTSGGAEVDLVLELPGGERWLIEIKRSGAPRPSKGFYSALGDLNPAKAFVVYAGADRYPISPQIEAIGLLELMGILAS